MNRNKKPDDERQIYQQTVRFTRLQIEALLSSVPKGASISEWIVEACEMRMENQRNPHDEK